MTSGRLVTTVMAALTVALVVVPAIDVEPAEGNSTALGAPRSAASSGPGSTPGSASSPASSTVRADSPAAKVLYLTIDDGPDEATPQVLGILARHRVPATFFLIGEHAAENPGLVQRIRREGHSIGNHTWSHPWLTTLTAAQVRSEFTRAQGVIGVSTCMRAPGGLENDTVTRQAAALGLASVGWTADSRDWQQPGVEAIRRNILTSVAPGGTILLHDGGGRRDETVAALGGVLTTLTRQGFTFETVPECR